VDVIVRLEESKEVSESWTVASLRQSLKKYISIHSNAQRYETLSKPPNLKGHKNFSFKHVSTTPVEGGNWKQWKRKPEMENGNGKWKQLKLDANEC